MEGLGGWIVLAGNVDVAESRDSPVPQTMHLAKKSYWDVQVGVEVEVEMGHDTLRRRCSRSAVAPSACLLQGRGGVGTYLWCDQLASLACASTGVMPASSLFCIGMLVECVGEPCHAFLRS